MILFKNIVFSKKMTNIIWEENILVKCLPLKYDKYLIIIIGWNIWRRTYLKIVCTIKKLQISGGRRTTGVPWKEEDPRCSEVKTHWHNYFLSRIIQFSHFMSNLKKKNYDTFWGSLRLSSPLTKSQILGIFKMIKIVLSS